MKLWKVTPDWRHMSNTPYVMRSEYLAKDIYHDILSYGIGKPAIESKDVGLWQWIKGQW